MAYNSLTSRAALLISLLTALLLSVGTSGALAAASANHRAGRSPRHHSKGVSRYGKTHNAKKVATGSLTLIATAAKATAPDRKKKPTKSTPTAPSDTAPTRTAPTTTTTPTATTTTTTTASSAEPVGIPGNWNLILDSEFNGSSLNTSLWHTGWYGNGVTGPVNSLETACYSPNNITFPGDGSMHLNLTATSSTCNGQTEPYTGALVSTNPNDGGGGFQYTYGVLEARVYIPGDGTQIANWPQVWADGQNWPQDGEDDLMEGLVGQACFHFHDPLGGPGNCDTTLTPGWHTFASDWQPGSVTYYYDGVNVGSINTGITSSPMYIVLENSISGDGVAADPGSMDVSYVRVWQN